MLGIEHAAGELVVGHALTKQLGYELLGQAGRVKPNPRLDSGIIAGELRAETRFTNGWPSRFHWLHTFSQEFGATEDNIGD